MTIITSLKGFTFAYPVFVMDNDKVVTITKASLIDMPELMAYFTETYNCTKVIFSGNKKYAENIFTKIKEVYKAKYSKECNLEYEYINIKK